MWRVGICLVLVTGCTKPNPNNCESGVCSDPAKPYCDVSGAISGTPKTCVAVSCTANAFEQCDGANAITCNSSGDNYTSVQCSHGCDDTAGCRVCEAGQTVCANGVVQTCDASGAVTNSQACPLGCFEDQPRCRDIDPSNGLATFGDMVTTAPDLVADDIDVNLQTGVVTDKATGATISIPTTVIPAATGGVDIRLLVVGKATLHDVGFSGTQKLAFALLARGPIEISGKVMTPGGQLDEPGCVGGQATITDRGDGASEAITGGGGGGGGFGTDGAPGGAVVNYETGGTKGAASGNESLVPLRGGCRGGTDSDTSGVRSGSGGSAGGALQLSSSTSIQITGTIDLSGAPGLPTEDYYGSSPALTCNVVSGGGSGGAILLEAPNVALSAAASVLTSGGAGSEGCDPLSAACGSGGSGAGQSGVAMPGANGSYAVGGCGEGGGGGGGMGRVRINSTSGMLEQNTGATIVGAFSLGTIKTR